MIEFRMFNSNQAVPPRTGGPRYSKISYLTRHEEQTSYQHSFMTYAYVYASFKFPPLHPLMTDRGIA